MEVHVIHPELKEAIFGIKTRPHLLHQTVVMQLNNRRAGTAATKSKGFVRGGKRVRVERAPAASDRRSGLVAARFLARTLETIHFVCRARHARKPCFQRSA